MLHENEILQKTDEPKGEPTLPIPESSGGDFDNLSDLDLEQASYFDLRVKSPTHRCKNPKYAIPSDSDSDIVDDNEKIVKTSVKNVSFLERDGEVSSKKITELSIVEENEQNVKPSIQRYLSFLDDGGEISSDN